MHTIIQQQHYNMSCATNTDFNAGVIGIWHTQTYQERQKQLKKDKQYQKMMIPIRKTHICYICHKYPGDEDYMFGMWLEKGKYRCFDCTC